MSPIEITAKKFNKEVPKCIKDIYKIYKFPLIDPGSTWKKREERRQGR